MATYRRKTARLEWGASRKLFSYTPGDDIALKGGSFARATVATYIDADGTRRTAASGVLRDAHYEQGLRTTLIERTSQNRCPNSENFSTGDWVVSDAVRTSVTVVGADLEASAYHLAPAATTAPHFLNHNSFVSVAGTRYSFSIDVKAGAASLVQLLFSSGEVTGNPRANFNLATGAKTAEDAGIVARIVPLRAGWYRISGSAEAAGTVMTPILALITTPTAVRGETFLGDGVSGVYIDAAQFETFHRPTSYIKTTGSVVTRNTDELDFPAGFAPQHLTMQAEFFELGTARDLIASSPGVMSIGASSDASLFLLTGGAGAYYGIHRRATDVATAGTLPLVTEGDRVQLRCTLSAAGSVNAHQSIGSGAEVSDTASAASALHPSAWSTDRIHIGSRGGNVGCYAFVGLAIVGQDVTRDRLRAVCRGGEIFWTELHLGYPLDEAVSYSRPAEGSAMAFLPSGAVDAWDAGETHVLQATVRWIPRENTASPLATGWDGVTGFRAFLAHARRGNPCWLSPDLTDLSAGWTMHVEAPFDDAPALEVDMTRSVALVLRSATPIEGY